MKKAFKFTKHKFHTMSILYFNQRRRIYKQDSMKNATYYTMEITVIVNHFLNKFSKVERGDKMDAIHITFLKNPYVDMYSLN